MSNNADSPAGDEDMLIFEQDLVCDTGGEDDLHELEELVFGSSAIMQLGDFDLDAALQLEVPPYC
jgi:hypothetical protein